MREKFLNIASVAAFQPGPLMSLYYATKAYILHFTEAISNEVKDKNICISVLCPGQTKTNFQKNVSTKKNKIKFNTACPIKVAKYGYESLKRNVTVSVPGFGIILLFFDKLIINSENYIYALITILGSTFYCIGGLLTLKLRNKKNENVTTSTTLWSVNFPFSVVNF